MNRKNKLRCSTISSELKNASLVKNKCEQLKLEKQQKSLDRLRARESINLTNKRKEILDLQMTILSLKPADEFTDVLHSPKREFSRNVTSIDGMHKMKFRSRALSISTSSIDTFVSPGNTHPLRKMSRSCSMSGNLDYFARRKFTTPSDRTAIRTEEESTSTNKAGSSPSEPGVWTILPPMQLTPLYKQKYKSLKGKSSHFDSPRSQDVFRSPRDQMYASKRKMSAPQEAILPSWNELQGCRYLRSRMNPGWCPESLYVARETDAKDPG